jgi:hypothetical protein
MKNFFLVLSLLVVVESCKKGTDLVATGQVIEYKISPSSVSSAVNGFDSDHYVYLDTMVAAKNKLFVFLPGTNASPGFYTQILKKAATLGYHSVGLMYANSSDIYVNSALSTNNDAFGLCRQEAFDGIDHSDGVSINGDNCVKNRLFKLLQYLSIKYPRQGWQQYLTATDVDWAKCTVAGHSQGGGLAFYIAKKVAVDRAIAFSSIDWNLKLDKSANWVSAVGATPIGRFYSVNHQHDELFPYTNVKAQLSLMGVQGPELNLDNNSVFANSHTLSTDATPALFILAPSHNATCVDLYVPRDGNGDVSVEYQRAWGYLLGN